MISRSLCRFILAGLVVPGWLVFLSAAFAAEPPSDPTQVETFVKNLYSPRSMTNLKQYADPSLAALIDEDARLTPQGDVGALDFDPFCSCQDDTGLQVQVVVRTVTPKAATVDANLTFSGNTDHRKDKITYHLVMVDGAWRIHDMSSKDVKSLRQLFITSNAQMVRKGCPARC